MRLKTKAGRDINLSDVGTTQIVEYFAILPVRIQYNVYDKENKCWLYGFETRWLEKVKIKQVLEILNHGSKYFFEWQDYGWRNYEFIDD